MFYLVVIRQSPARYCRYLLCYLKQKNCVVDLKAAQIADVGTLI